MKIFDGSNNISIIRSLASVFNIREIELKYAVRNYYKINKWRLDRINSYYDEFIDFLKLQNYMENIQFDYVYFFHVTYSIDSLKSIKEFGVLDLRESLIKETALKKYLQHYGIDFKLNDKVELITQSKRIKMKIFNSQECDEKDYWKNFYGEYLHNRLNFDYNINGFLFKSNVYKDSNYFNLKNTSEFLDQLGSFLENKDISAEWEKMRKSYILKCKIDIGQTTLGNGLTWPTKHEVSRTIIERALYYMVELEQNKKELPPITYILINSESSIPFDDLEVLNYKIEFREEDYYG